MAWVAAHLPHILGGGAAGGGAVAVLAVAFKDWIKDWMADAREERQMRRAAAKLEHGKGSVIGEQLVSVLREDLGERRMTDKRVVEILEKISGAQERIETKQDQHGRQIDVIHQRIIKVQAGLGGAFQ